MRIDGKLRNLCVVKLEFSHIGAACCDAVHRRPRQSARNNFAVVQYWNQFIIFKTITLLSTPHMPLHMKIFQSTTDGVIFQYAKVWQWRERGTCERQNPISRKMINYHGTNTIDGRESIIEQIFFHTRALGSVWSLWLVSDSTMTMNVRRASERVWHESASRIVSCLRDLHLNFLLNISTFLFNRLKKASTTGSWNFCCCCERRRQRRQKRNSKKMSMAEQKAPNKNESSICAEPQRLGLQGDKRRGKIKVSPRHDSRARKREASWRGGKF